MSNEGTNKVFELIERTKSGHRIAVRDDQYDLQTFLDAGRAARGRLGLIDTGVFEINDLDLLLRAGIDVCTSDDVRKDLGELSILTRAAKRSGAFLALLAEGGLPSPDGNEGAGFNALAELAGSGMDLHVPGSDKLKRDLEVMERLAAASRRGGSYFVYYHHGAPSPGLEALAGCGAWIHIPDRDIDAAENGESLVAAAAACKSAGSRLVVHVEKGLPIDLLKRMHAAGAHLNFLSPPSGRGSLQKALEDRAANRELPVRAYYLTLSFIP